MLLNYNCDEGITDQELLKATNRSLRDLLSAHFQIAMTHLANHDRQQAEVHLKRAVETRCFYPFQYHICQALLARMKAKPDWPPWVDRKEVDVDETAAGNADLTNKASDEPAASEQSQ